MRREIGSDAREAWRFARAIPRRGSWAQETATQAAKAGIAALLAWFVAAHLLHFPQSYLAPWVALVVVRPTVHWSVLTGLRQVAGVVLGVMVALVSVSLMPGKELALAVAVPAAFLVSHWPRLGDQGLYVPFTAMFLVAVDSVEGPIVLFRLLETGIGAAIGMSVNLLLAPPVRTMAVHDRVERDAAAMAGLLRDIAAGVREGRDAGDDSWSARVRHLDERFAHARASLGRSHDSLRLNPRSSETHLHESIAWTEAALDLIQRVNRSVRALADLLDDGDRDGLPDPSLDPAFAHECAALLEAFADTCERRLAAQTAQDTGPEEPESALRERFDRLERTASTPGLDPVTGEAQAALLVAVRRLLRDLDGS